MNKIQAIPFINEIPLELCPCSVIRRTCRRDDTGETFEIAEVKSFKTDQTYFLYEISSPERNLFAGEICRALRKPHGQHLTL